MNLRKKKYRMWWIILSVLLLLAAGVVVFLHQPKFGRTPRGERMERVRKSPHYRDGKFQNIHETQQITSDKGFLGSAFDFLFRDIPNLHPQTALPVVKTDLWQMSRDQDILIWFGHSSYMIQVDGKRILVDPVFCEASPVSFFNRPFKGTDVYKPEDIPETDYLFISHDHWDHLDYKTVMSLKDRIGKVVCGLGVGEHFEYWGFEKDRIIELDWQESASLGDGFTVYGLPARHFSGRGLSPNQTLWASYLVQTPSQKIYIAGDGGYDTHFADIGQQFPDIDLVILENGQYDKDWRYIHLLPEQMLQTIRDLQAKKVLTVHNSKYALGKHSWKAPLDNVADLAEQDSLHIWMPVMGEVVSLNDTVKRYTRWWKDID